MSKTFKIHIMMKRKKGFSHPSKRPGKSSTLLSIKTSTMIQTRSIETMRRSGKTTDIARALEDLGHLLVNQQRRRCMEERFRFSSWQGLIEEFKLWQAREFRHHMLQEMWWVHTQIIRRTATLILKTPMITSDHLTSLHQTVQNPWKSLRMIECQLTIVKKLRNNLWS